MNFEQEYEWLASGEKQALDFEVSFLFDMANYFVVIGQYDKKAKIYEEWILHHPRATDDDVVRVQAYQLDLQRRKGDPEGALAGLQSLTPPQERMATLEWLQAIGQCLLMTGNLAEAIDTQRDIVKLLNETIPADKQLYYLETIMAMKLAARQADEELMEYFQRYEQLLQSPDLAGKIRDRAVGISHDLKGRSHVLRNEWTDATSSFLAYFETVPAVRNKVVACIQFLDAVFRGGFAPPRTRELVEFFRAHSHELQPTDIAGAYKEQYEFVMSRLGVDS